MQLNVFRELVVFERYAKIPESTLFDRGFLVYMKIKLMIVIQEYK